MNARKHIHWRDLWKWERSRNQAKITINLTAAELYEAGGDHYLARIGAAIYLINQL